MSTKVVLQNIYYFIHTVLQKAYVDNKWDKESVECGLKWAYYCEQIYERTIRLPINEHFDSLIRQLSSTITCSVLPYRVELKHLRCASDIFLSAILQNPFVSSDVFDLVTSKLKNKEILSSITTLKQGVWNIVDWMKNEKYDYPLGTDTFPMFRWQLFELELYKHDLNSLVQQCSSKIDLKTALLDFIKSLDSSRETLITVLLLVADYSITEDREVKKVLLEEWLAKKLKPDSEEFDEQFNHIFWHLPTYLLHHVCTKSLAFYRIYVSMLVKHAEELEAEYCSKGWKWKVKEEENSKFFLQFEDIIRHFSSLMKSANCVSETTEKLVQDLSSSEKRILWKDILQASKNAALLHQKLS